MSFRPSLIAAWTGAAALSIGVAGWLALQPDRASDLRQVLAWLTHVATTGSSVYPIAGMDVDYPPHALMLLGPLLWLPAGQEVEVFLAVNLMATCAMAYLLPWWMSREARIPMSTTAHLVFALMVLTWGPVRVALWNGQTVALALSAGVLAVTLSAKRPWLAALALTLAATKPSLGIGFGLILLFRGHVRVLGLATVLVLGLTLQYEKMADIAWLSSLAEYSASLQNMYAADEWVRGVTTIRPAIFDALSGHWLALPLFATLGLATLLALCGAAYRTHRRPEAQALLAVACLMWTLVALPNQRYYLVLLAPAIWLLVHTPEALRLKGRWAQWSAGILIVFLATDGVVVLRYLAEQFGDKWPTTMAWMWWMTYVAAAPLVLGMYALLVRAMLTRLPAQR